MRNPLASPLLRTSAFVVMSGLVACGPTGGSSGGAMPPASTATSTGTTSTTASTMLPTTNVANIATSVQVPQASSVVTITEIVSTAPPSGTPALSVARASQIAQAATRTTLAAPQTTILYVELLPSASVTIDGTPGLSFTLPSIPAGTTYYLAQYETVAGTLGWVAPAQGPGTVTGTTVSFPLTPGAILITPTTPIVVALYSVAAGSTPSPVSSGSPLPAASASPSPGVTATPSPGVTATPVVAPTTLTFDANAPTTASFTVSETGDTAPYAAAITCAPASTPTPTGSATPTPAPAPFVVQLSATSATPTAGVATFSVISGNDAGICSIVVTDAESNTATETVDVTSSQLGIFATRRNAR